jgi:adenosylcobinamide-phosphate synthase
LLIVASVVMSGGSGRAAWRVGLRDRRKLPSPNAGWSEATVAGALGLRLCGPIWRKGKLASDFWLGDPDARAEVTNADLQRMNRLARMATWLFSGGLVIVFSLGWVPVGWPS